MSVYHSILGVSNNASLSEIKKAYRFLARKFHPDLNSDADAHEQFIRIAQAYEILSGELKSPHRAPNKSYSTEDIANSARERAKQYAKMRYEDFKKQSEAYESTPMHKILWPKWVNFIILAIAMLFVIDDLLPLKNVEGVISNGSNHSFYIGNHRFHAANEHRNSMLAGKNVSAKTTPILGFVVSYCIADHLVSNSVEPMRKETEFVPLMYILALLTLVCLINKTKKFENKLLVKALMSIDMFMFALLFFSRYN